MTLSKFEDMKAIVKVEPIRSQKSQQQLGYLWGIVYPEIASHTGHLENELHELFKRKFLKPRIIKWRETEVQIPNEFKRLSKGEVSEFIQRVMAEAADMGIIIPEADPTKSTTRLDI